MMRHDNQSHTFMSNFIALLVSSIRYVQQFSILLYEGGNGTSNYFFGIRNLINRARVKLNYIPIDFN